MKQSRKLNKIEKKINKKKSHHFLFLPILHFLLFIFFSPFYLDEHRQIKIPDSLEILFHPTVKIFLFLPSLFLFLSFPPPPLSLLLFQSFPPPNLPPNQHLLLILPRYFHPIHHFLTKDSALLLQILLNLLLITAPKNPLVGIQDNYLLIFLRSIHHLVLNKGPHDILRVLRGCKFHHIHEICRQFLGEGRVEIGGEVR